MRDYLCVLCMLYVLFADCVQLHAAAGSRLCAGCRWLRKFLQECALRHCPGLDDLSSGRRGGRGCIYARCRLDHGGARGTRRCPTMGQADPVVGGSARRRHVLATRARACAARSEGCAAADGGRQAALVAMDRGGQLARAASGRPRRWWAAQRWIVRCRWPGGGGRRRAAAGRQLRRRVPATHVRALLRTAGGGRRALPLAAWAGAAGTRAVDEVAEELVGSGACVDGQ